MMARVLDNLEDEAVIADVREAVAGLAARFPLYQ
jgi:glycine/serine hydroxymethyltransferase